MHYDRDFPAYMKHFLDWTHTTPIVGSKKGLAAPHGEECYQCQDCRRKYFSMSYKQLKEKRTHKEVDDAFHECRTLCIRRKLNHEAEGTRDRDPVVKPDVELLIKRSVEESKQEYDDEYYDVKFTPIRKYAKDRSIPFPKEATDEDVQGLIWQHLPDTVFGTNKAGELGIETKVMGEGELIIRRGARDEVKKSCTLEYGDDGKHMVDEGFEADVARLRQSSNQGRPGRAGGGNGPCNICCSD